MPQVLSHRGGINVINKSFKVGDVVQFINNDTGRCWTVEEDQGGKWLGACSQYSMAVYRRMVKELGNLL